MAIPSEASAKVAKLYKRQSNGGYVLQHPLDHEQGLDMAKFMLSRGKLFDQQNMPIYCTTFASSINCRPFLLMKSASETVPQVPWAKLRFKDRPLIPAVRHTSNKFFLVVPAALVDENETMVYAVQIVMKDRTTRNFYLDYLPE